MYLLDYYTNVMTIHTMTDLQVPASVVTLKNENVGANQQRVNERPVDVGPSVRTNATVTEAQVRERGNI